MYVKKENKTKSKRKKNVKKPSFITVSQMLRYFQMLCSKDIACKNNSFNKKKKVFSHNTVNRHTTV